MRGRSMRRASRWCARPPTSQRGPASSHAIARRFVRRGKPSRHIPTATRSAARRGSPRAPRLRSCGAISDRSPTRRPPLQTFVSTSRDWRRITFSRCAAAAACRAGIRPSVARSSSAASSPGADAADLDSAAFALLRGFPANTFAGSHVAVANAEYRWPLARPQRGHGTWPLFVHSLHAAVFADAGHAWTQTFRA